MPQRIDPIALARALIRCPSVTPEDAGAQQVLADALERIGFRVWRHVWGEAPDGPVHNLYAVIGRGAPHFAFAGHTDVVPPGDPGDWEAAPFAAELRGGMLIGRGAADMKSAIAAFVAAAARFGPPPSGTISLIITGDEEGPAVHGTSRLLDWMKGEGHRPDACVVGEPTSRAALGDTMKIGRRGSVNIWIDVGGAQGHVAYPRMAENPIPQLVEILHRLRARRLDEGNSWFEPSNLEVTDLAVGNAAHNVIPARAGARLNIRFNDEHRGEDLVRWVEETARSISPRARVEAKISGEAFLTAPGPFTDLVAGAVASVTGAAPQASTGGGTSDARFIRSLCPVVELGLVGASMHKVGEHARIEDVARLSIIYEEVLRRFFASIYG